MKLLKRLQAETKFFDDNVGGWREKHPGEYALIVDSNPARFFSTRREAYRFGLEKYGNRSMLIQQVRAGQDAAAPLTPLSRSRR